MPYMREFFNEKFQVPIEFFNPLQSVTVSESASTLEVTRSSYLLGEAVGLALRSATTCPMELNLLPASAVRRQELEKRRPFIIVAAACVFLGLVGLLRAGRPGGAPEHTDTAPKERHHASRRNAA